MLKTIRGGRKKKPTVAPLPLRADGYFKGEEEMRSKEVRRGRMK